MGLIENGLKWLGEQRRKADGISVTYTRGIHSCVISDAVVDINELELLEGSTVRVIETREYLFAAADLELDNQVVEPKRGDRITEARGDVELLHEVTEFPGLPCWSYQDPARQMIRVRAKRVG